MLRPIFFALILFLACSKDQPAPIAPAGKTAQFDDMFSAFNDQELTGGSTLLANPSGPKVIEVTSSYAVIRWDNVEAAWGYDVSFREEGEQWKRIDRVRYTRINLGYVYELMLDSLKHSTEYHWGVRARDNWDGNVKSQWTTGPSFTTLDSSATLRFPKNQQVKMSGEDWITLTWDEVEGATGYDVRFDTDKGSFDPIYGGWEYFEWCHSSVQDTSITVSRIEDCDNHENDYGFRIRSSTLYRWSVRAKNGQTFSPWTATRKFVTQENSEFTDHTPTNVVLHDPNRFNISLIFEDKFHPIVEEVIKEGAETWERVIVGDLPDQAIEYKGASYEVDDLLIVVRNGFNHTYDSNLSWVSRGDIVYRSDNPALRHTAIAGTMVIDSHLEGYLRRVGHKKWSDNVVLKARMKDLSYTRWLTAHEIGHVLGLAFLKSAVGDDGKCYWEGEKANALFGGKIPLGLLCGHWADAYFPNGVVSSLGAIRQDFYQTYQVYDFITDIEVAAVEDLGYTVDYAHAVPSVIQLSGSPPSGKVSAELPGDAWCLHGM